MFGNKYDKTVIVFLQRTDALVPYVTQGTRLKSKADDILFRYEILHPLAKSPQVIQDIPANYINSSGVLMLTTSDMEQYKPVSAKSLTQEQIALDVMTSEQKVWYEKGIKEAVLRTANQGWWDNNKMLIMTIIVMGGLCLMLYIGLTQGNNAINTYNQLVQAQNSGLEKLYQLCNSSFAGNLTRPPA